MIGNGMNTGIPYLTDKLKPRKKRNIKGNIIRGGVHIHTHTYAKYKNK